MKGKVVALDKAYLPIKYKKGIEPISFLLFKSYHYDDFSIHNCYSIMDDSILEDDRWQNVSIDDDLIETQEDMYYYALLQLYMTSLASIKTTSGSTFLMQLAMSSME